MNIRELLIALRENLDGYEDTIGDAEMLDTLIAERPYEPGEKILVGHVDDEAIFFCAHPNDNTIVLAQRYCDDKPSLWHNHRPRPKTYRVKPVPDDIVEAAKKVANSPSMARHGTTVDARLVTDWIANPDNWEAGNE